MQPRSVFSILGMTHSDVTIITLVSCVTFWQNYANWKMTTIKMVMGEKVAVLSDFGNWSYCIGHIWAQSRVSPSLKIDRNCLRFLWHNKVGPKSKNYVLWSSKWKIERKKEKFSTEICLKVPLHALSKGAETFLFCVCHSYYKNGLTYRNRSFWGKDMSVLPTPLNSPQPLI